MHTFKATIVPRSAYATPLKGDTLFGQLCWMLRHRHGEAHLEHLLEGYTQGKPFAVISDAFPSGHLPRPSLPSYCFKPIEGEDRKAVKRRTWLPLERAMLPVSEWLKACKSDKDISAKTHSHPHPHNSIDRRTSTTGQNFAPYTVMRQWFDPDAKLDIYIVLDQERLKGEDLKQALHDVGEIGFGKDSGIGLGHFELAAFEPFEFPRHARTNAWFTLAPCAPQGQAWDEERCFYNTFVRFGRHGDIAARLGNPFKNPVLLAQTGAVLSPLSVDGIENIPFTGQGLGTHGELSKTIPNAVHQGYAPVVAIHLPPLSANPSSS